MSSGEMLMRLTIALSVAAYAGAEYLWYRHRRGAFRARAILWTIAAVLCIVHSALAFEVRHGWSHDAALRQTAEQTAAVTGVAYGAGLYVNYAFLALWAADVIWLWAAAGSYLRRPAAVNAAVSAFFLFMFVNGAVIFARGPVRILGLAATLSVAWAWWRSRDKIVSA